MRLEEQGSPTPLHGLSAILLPEEFLMGIVVQVLALLKLPFIVYSTSIRFAHHRNGLKCHCRSCLK